MKEVKEKGKECIILTNQTAHVNSALTAVADQLIFCEQKATKAVRDKHSRAKIAELLGRLFNKSKECVLPISSLNDYFVNHGYNFKAHGYVSFKECLEECINEINYRIDFDEGTITKN
jgi:predicted solute-binding protein